MPGKKILIVEGLDDQHVLGHLCTAGNVGRLDEIKSSGGIEMLLESIPVRLKESDVDMLGVLLDADLDIAARWKRLKNYLQKAGYPNIPDQPDAHGTILPGPPDSLLPRFGVWIMPDNRSNGILEDYLRFLIPQGSRLFEHVELSVDGIPETERLFSPLAKSKAVIHTWLAWQKEPGTPFGTAITARYLNPNVDQVNVLVAWLKRLFFPQAA